MAAIPSCPICFGRRPYCIHKSYPLPRPDWIAKQVQEQLKKEFSGPAYSVFVGREGYPNVTMGPMAGLQLNPMMDNPAAWFGKSYTDIITMRSLLIRSKQPQSVFSRERFVLENQELAMARKPADTEITFEKTPFYRFTLSDRLQPMGPSGDLVRMRITENTKIAPAVERIVGDEFKAAEAVTELYKKGQDVYKINTILSSGALGMEQAKKLVPTRWSITATDDMVAKGLIEKIKQFPETSDYLVFESTYIDNHFLALVLPGAWEFENFEAWAPRSWPQALPAATGQGSSQTQSRIIEEYEPYAGRKNYAENQAGGYYARRIGATEGLIRLRKQGRVVVFREVSEGYTIPLGVWVVRETVRNAMQGTPKKFSTFEEALAFVGPKLKLKLNDYMKQSRILQRKTIRDFVPAA